RKSQRDRRAWAAEELVSRDAPEPESSFPLRTEKTDAWGYDDWLGSRSGSCPARKASVGRAVATTDPTGATGGGIPRLPAVATVQRRPGARAVPQASPRPFACAPVDSSRLNRFPADAEVQRLKVFAIGTLPSRSREGLDHD